MGNVDGWDELDAGSMWGVFATEAYSPEPAAMFRERREAEEWLAWQRSAGMRDDSLVAGADYAICEVRRLEGVVWNSILEAPDETPTRDEARKALHTDDCPACAAEATP